MGGAGGVAGNGRYTHRGCRFYPASDTCAPYCALGMGFDRHPISSRRRTVRFRGCHRTVRHGQRVDDARGDFQRRWAGYRIGCRYRGGCHPLSGAAPPTTRGWPGGMGEQARTGKPRSRPGGDHTLPEPQERRHGRGPKHRGSGELPRVHRWRCPSRGCSGLVQRVGAQAGAEQHKSVHMVCADGLGRPRAFWRAEATRVARRGFALYGTRASDSCRGGGGRAGEAVSRREGPPDNQNRQRLPRDTGGNPVRRSTDWRTGPIE